MRSVSGNEAILEYCSQKAEQFGYKMFGADEKTCWSGDDPENTYNLYGQSTKCSKSKQTGYGSGREFNGDIFVYVLSKWGMFQEGVKNASFIQIVN